MNRGAWQAIVHGVTKSCIWLNDLQWHPTPVLLPGKSHGWRSLVGCSPWGRRESDMTERLHFHFSLSCTGEGNGNPLQYACLENPKGWGAWWAAVSGVAQSQTWLKRLSSSSSSRMTFTNSNIILTHKHPHKHTQNNVWPNVWEFSWHKIDHHSGLTMELFYQHSPSLILINWPFVQLS